MRLLKRIALYFLLLVSSFLFSTAAISATEEEIQRLLDSYADKIEYGARVAKSEAVGYILKKSIDSSVTQEFNGVFKQYMGRPSLSTITPASIKKDMDRFGLTLAEMDSYISKKIEMYKRNESRLKNPSNTYSNSSSPQKTAPPKSASSSKNVICQMPEARVKEDLKRDLLERYPTSYSLVKKLLDRNIDYYHRICLIPNSSPHKEILSDLKQRYYPSMSVIYKLYSNNIKAYHELNQ